MLTHCPVRSLYNLPLPTDNQGGLAIDPPPGFGVNWALTFLLSYFEFGLDLFPHIGMSGELLCFHNRKPPCAQVCLFLVPDFSSFFSVLKSSSDHQQNIYHSQVHVLLVLMCLSSTTLPMAPTPPSPWMGRRHSPESQPCVWSSATVKTFSDELPVSLDHPALPSIPSVHLLDTPLQLSTLISLRAPLLAASLECLTSGSSSYALQVPYSSCLVVSPIPEQNEWISLFCVVSLLFIHIGNYLRMEPSFVNFLISSV